MADNVVEILVKSRDDAKPDLDALKARLDELKDEVATARADVDDSDAAAKLDALQAKLLNLDKKTANPKITMSGALSAEAQIHAVEAAMKHLDTTAADGGPGWRSRAAGFAGAAASVTGLGDAMNVASPDASMFQRVMAGAGLATGLFEPVVAGATVALGGMASGLLAGASGLGVFAITAKGVFAQVTPAVTAYETAQSTTGKASATAMKKYQAQLAAMSPDQQKLTQQVIGMKDAWNSFTQDATAGVSKVFQPFVTQILPQVLRSMRTFLPMVENALSSSETMVANAMNTKGFKSFVQMLANEAGPALDRIVLIVMNLAKGFGGILTAFMPMANTMMHGVVQLTAKFAEWGSTLNQHTGFQSLMSTFKTETPIAMGILKNLLEVLKNVGGAMAGLATGSNSKTLLQVLEPLSGILAQLSKNQDLVRIVLYFLAATDAGKKLKNTVQGIQGAFSVFGNAVNLLGKFGKAAEDASMGAKVAAAATRVWTGVQAAFDVVMDANPIVLLVIGIAALIAVIVLIATKTRWFQEAWDASWGFIKKTFDDVFGWIKSHWPLILAILTGPIGLAALFIIKHWHDILSGAESMVHAVTSWFTRLPGMIVRALGNLDNLLLNAGKAVISGLWNGLKAQAGMVIGWVQNFAGMIGHAFSSVLHILSPSKVFEDHGKMIAAGLIQGMDGSRGLVTAAASRLARSTIPGQYPAAAGAGGGGGSVVIQFQPGGSGLDQMFMTWLKNSVRTQGGDPSMFNKKVAFVGA